MSVKAWVVLGLTTLASAVFGVLFISCILGTEMALLGVMA